MSTGIHKGRGGDVVVRGGGLGASLPAGRGVRGSPVPRAQRY